MTKLNVIPAKAGTQLFEVWALESWFPAFAGLTANTSVMPGRDPGILFLFAFLRRPERVAAFK